MRKKVPPGWQFNLFHFSKLRRPSCTFWLQVTENQGRHVGTVDTRSVVEFLCYAPERRELAGQKMGRILIVASDSTEREGLALVIELTGHNCATTASLQEAVSLLGNGSFDLVVTERIWKIEDSDPGQIVKSLKKACPGVRVMILSHNRIEGSIPGADYFAVIPFSPKKLQDSIRQALRKKSSRLPPRKVFEEKAVGRKGTERAKTAVASSLPYRS